MSISLHLFISVVFSVVGLPSCFSADQHYEECREPLRCGSGLSVFPNITYPFWGNSIGKPKFCGQTEFELSCRQNQTLTLGTEKFTLRVISANLDKKTITVADDSLFEGGCPKIWDFKGDDQFSLNPTTETIDLFDCTDNPAGYYPPISLSTISCDQSKENPRTYHVFRSANSSHNCAKVGEIPMLESAKNALHQSNDSNRALKTALEKGFELRYTIEDKVCRGCTESRGICGSESDSGSFRCLCADKPHNSSCNDEKG